MVYSVITMGASHRTRMTTAAHHMLMVFLPNLTIARIDSENAARFHNRATTPEPNAHKYTLHRYLGLGSFELKFMRTLAEPNMNIKATATTNPAKRRLMRKMRTGLGIEVAMKSARMVNPITTLATIVTTASSKE